MEKNIDFNWIHSVDWVIMAFMMVKNSAIEIVGLLDDKYFIHVEDMDCCKRFWGNVDWVFYYPELLVEYKGTRKSISPLLNREALGPSHKTILFLMGQ